MELTTSVYFEAVYVIFIKHKRKFCRYAKQDVQK